MSKYSFKGILIASLKCVLYYGAWFLMSFVATYIITLLIQLTSKPATKEELTALVESKSVIIAVFSNALSIVGFAIFYSKIRNTTLFERAEIRPTSFKVGLNSATLGISSQIVIILILNSLLKVIPKSWQDMLSDQNAPILNVSMAMQIVYTVIMAPLLEEILFRGLMLGALKKEMPSWVAIAISALAFGAAHGNPIGIIYATLFGVLLGWVFIRTKSILPCIILHMGFNATALACEGGIPYIIVILAIPVAIYGIVSIYKNTKENEGDNK